MGNSHSLRKNWGEFTRKIIVLIKLPGHIVFNNDAKPSARFEPYSESV